MMKRYTIFLFLLPLFMSAQSLEITSFDSVIYGHATNDLDIYGNASIRNNASQDIEVMVTRSVDTSNTLTQSNAICWGMCFAPEVDTSPVPITINAGMTNSNDFNGHVYPPMDGVPRSGTITYTFFDKNNPSDQVSMTVTYITTTNFSVNEKKNEKIRLKVYPNPAKEMVYIDMHQINSNDVRLIVNDVIGNTIMEKQISGYSNRETIDIHALRSGYYFFNLYVDGNLLGTKRVHVVQ